MAHVTNFLGLLEQLQSADITVHQGRCAIVRNRNATCMKCADVCTSGCISYDDNELVIEPERCIGCGTCATVCPTCGFKLLGATQAMQPLVMSETPAATVEESAPARATLNVVRGPQVGISFVLTGEPVTIGRSPQCTIFLNDMTVSRMHATIEQENGCYVIRDANSFNGVWVNNDSVEARALRPGDFIQIGTFCMQYEEN